MRGGLGLGEVQKGADDLETGVDRRALGMASRTKHHRLYDHEPRLPWWSAARMVRGREGLVVVGDTEPRVVLWTIGMSVYGTPTLHCATRSRASLVNVEPKYPRLGADRQI